MEKKLSPEAAKDLQRSLMAAVSHNPEQARLDIKLDKINERITALQSVLELVAQALEAPPEHLADIRAALERVPAYTPPPASRKPATAEVSRLM